MKPTSGTRPAGAARGLRDCRRRDALVHAFPKRTLEPVPGDGLDRQHRAQARMIVGEIKPATVQSRNGGDEAKPQPYPRGAAAGVAAIEPLDDSRAFFFSDDRSMIGDGD